MKKHLFSSDKYTWIKSKGNKKFISNLPNVDKINDDVSKKNMEEQARRKIEERNKKSDALDQFEHIFKKPFVKHDTNKKLCVLVPYRDRVNHLNVFKNEIPKYLDSQGIDYHICVIEQSDFNIKFNKGMLFNIGFLENKNFDYYCLHDVDLIPMYADYGYDSSIPSNMGILTHLSKWVEQFNYNEIESCYGGVVLIDKKTVYSINGYSIGYWGWGFEDDDFKRRCSNYGRALISKRDGIYKSLPHEHNYSHLTYVQNSSHFYRNVKNTFDGLNQTKYKILSREKINNKITMISVTFEV